MEYPTLEEWFDHNMHYDERRQNLPPDQQQLFDAYTGQWDLYHLFTAHQEPHRPSYEDEERVGSWDEFEELVDDFYSESKVQSGCVVNDGNAKSLAKGRDEEHIGEQDEGEKDEDGDEEEEEKAKDREQDNEELEEKEEDEGATIAQGTIVRSVSGQPTPEEEKNEPNPLKRKEQPDSTEKQSRPGKFVRPFRNLKRKAPSRAPSRS